MLPEEFTGNEKRWGTPPAHRYLCLFICQEDEKQADPPNALALTLHTVPGAAKEITEPQLHRLGGCRKPGTQPWGMPPPREVGHLRQDRQGHVGKCSSPGHTCPGASGKEDFLNKGRRCWQSRSPQGYLWGGGIRDKFPRQKSPSSPRAVWPPS